MYASAGDQFRAAQGAGFLSAARWSAVFFDRINETFSPMQGTVKDILAEGDGACIRCSRPGKVIEAWQNWDMQGDGRKAATYIGAS
jgi:hypothetical protein